MGDLDRARDHCREALRSSTEHDDLDCMANAEGSLGFIEHHRGHHSRAIDHYSRALTLYDTYGDLYLAAETYEHLGHPHAALGHYDHARNAWLQARRMYRQQGRDADDARVHLQLTSLDMPGDDQRQVAGPTHATE
ncbi:tetratricopeptide repeat protein [Actinosynnema sp. NPDC050436]|uniref:tetratricopeptide repeat protein n=1 Tax=Actinosynnema sp. NPDC050436 TaxID=3155659 RepID=UPI0033E1A4C6